MSHYDIDYSKLEEPAKSAKAISDCKFYLGRSYAKILRIIAEDASTLEGRKVLLSFAGVQGFPA